MISTIGPETPVSLTPEQEAHNAAILARLQADEEAEYLECQRIQAAARARDKKRRKKKWRERDG